jgi:hypothetical protein
MNALVTDVQPPNDVARLREPGTGPHELRDRLEFMVIRAVEDRSPRAQSIEETRTLGRTCLAENSGRKRCPRTL